MTLHLLRIGIDRHALQRFAVERRLDDDDAGYALHAALAARFGAAAPRPFRFLPDHPRGAHLLGYVADAAALGDAAALPPADDGAAAIFPGDHQLQPMPDAWREGARYAFEVRVRPVVRFGKQARAARGERGGWQPRAGEIDAFVAACERAVATETERGTDGAPDSDIESLNIGGISREAIYADWLTARLNGAATIEHAGLRDFRRARTRRNTHAGKGNTGGQPRTRAVEGPDAVMAGTLAVADPAAFTALLAGGVGRHAAFGFGMLLLAPPGRAG